MACSLANVSVTSSITSAALRNQSFFHSSKGSSMACSPASVSVTSSYHICCTATMFKRHRN